MNDLAYIYKIVNPNNKIYIGSTINLNDRIYRYKTLRIKSQRKIYNSIIKYGWGNHKFYIVCICSIKDKLYYESFYGNLYNTLSDNGLNLSLPKSNMVYGGLSQETKLKIGLKHKGKKINDEQKKIISENSKKWHQNNTHPLFGKKPWNDGKEFLKGELNPMYGIKRSFEWKYKHSERAKIKNKKGVEHHASKIVFDKDSFVFYNSVKEVSDLYNIKYSTLKCNLNGTRKSKNSKWEYC